MPRRVHRGDGDTGGSASTATTGLLRRHVGRRGIRVAGAGGRIQPTTDPLVDHDERHATRPPVATAGDRPRRGSGGAGPHDGRRGLGRDPMRRRGLPAIPGARVAGGTPAGVAGRCGSSVGHPAVRVDDHLGLLVRKDGDGPHRAAQWPREVAARRSRWPPVRGRPRARSGTSYPLTVSRPSSSTSIVTNGLGGTVCPISHALPRPLFRVAAHSRMKRALSGPQYHPSLIRLDHNR